MTTLPATRPKQTARIRLGAIARRHRAFLIMLAAATVLRLLVMKAYQPAFWYDGDSGSYLSASQRKLLPDAQVAYGYVVFLKAFRWTHTLASVAGVQHLLGLGVAIASYALLQRRGVARWISCVAVAPLLFDVLELSIEHHVLVETPYIALLCASVGVLLWRTSPTVLTCAASGLLLAGAWFVKPLALPIAVVLVGYLMLRRTGWRRWTAFAVAFALPYLVVLAWVGGRASPYGSNNLALYSRVAGFANCAQLQLTDAERAICPSTTILGHRPDWYAWVKASPGYGFRRTGTADPVLRDFALAVLTQQPGDYAHEVLRELAPHFVDGINLGPEFGCLTGRYSLPASAQPTGGGECHPEMAAVNFLPGKATPKFNPGPSNLRRAFALYSDVAHTPRVLVTGTFLLTGLALIAVRRARTRRTIAAAATLVVAHRRSAAALAADAVMLLCVAGSIIVLPVLVGMYEPRYALPAMPFIGVAAGFAARALSQSRRRRDPVAMTIAAPAAAAQPVGPGPARAVANLDAASAGKTAPAGPNSHSRRSTTRWRAGAAHGDDRKPTGSLPGDYAVSAPTPSGEGDTGDGGGSGLG